MGTPTVVIALLSSLAATPESVEHSPGRTLYPDRAQCALNLLEVGRRLASYAGGHGGELPPKLSDAFTDADPKTLGCLACPGMAPMVFTGGFRVSYAYVRPKQGRLTRQEAGDDILVFDLEPVHEGGRNVLFANLEVKHFEEAEFDRLLSDQRDRWTKRGRTLEVVRHDVIPLQDEDAIGTAVGEHGPGGGSRHLRLAAILVAAILAVGLLLFGVKAWRGRAGGDDSAA
jgi:hypothetical protein